MSVCAKQTTVVCTLARVDVTPGSGADELVAAAATAALAVFLPLPPVWKTENGE